MELPTCYCGAPSRLRDGIYGKFWSCTRWPKCDGVVGCHPGGSKPLGLMVDKATRAVRTEAHRAFDPLWMGLKDRPCPGGGSWRAVAYRWLATIAGRPGQDVHMGNMTKAEAERVLALLYDKGPTHILEFLKWELEDSEKANG